MKSSFPQKDQGEISGLSRSVSNLGSSLGTAIVGSAPVPSLFPENQTYGWNSITLVAEPVLPDRSVLHPSEPVKSGTATRTGEMGEKA